MFVKSDVVILTMFQFHENRCGVFANVPVLAKLNSEDGIVFSFDPLTFELNGGEW